MPSNPPRGTTRSRACPPGPARPAASPPRRGVAGSPRHGERAGALELVAERLAVLYRLSQGEPVILVANGDSLTNRLPPPEYVVSRSLLLAKGQRLDLTEMRLELSAHGYLQVPKVVEHGEFAVRGSLMDLFPAGSDHPVRIDLFDDEVEALRLFDPASQLSTDRVAQVRILPAREFPTDAAGVKRFRENFRHQFSIDPSKSAVYREVSEGRMPAGIECSCSDLR